MRRCYFSKNYKGIGTAGDKAKTDIEQIMEDIGFVNIGMKRTFHKNKVKGFFITLLGVLKVAVSVRKNDYLVIQYPLKKYYTFICKAAHLRGAKVITLIHDLGSFRRKKLTADDERKRLSNTDYIIALNEKMRDWLISDGYKQPIGAMGLWDYLSDSEPVARTIPDKFTEIIHTGGLPHWVHSYIYALDKEEGANANYHITLYGSRMDNSPIIHKDKYTFINFMHPDDIIATAKGDFGLVWYGHSIDEIDGPYGEYLKITTSHKPSLYLRCHIPIITWSQSALAIFVKEHNIGICIDSLRDLNEVLSSITKEQYTEMMKNVIEISKKVSDGYFFNQAYREAEKALSNQPE